MQVKAIIPLFTFLGVALPPRILEERRGVGIMKELIKILGIEYPYCYKSQRMLSVGGEGGGGELMDNSRVFCWDTGRLGPK